MKETIDYIWRRRSIRSYTGEAVKEEDFRELLEAAMAAPSARCCDPWEFIVINDPDTLLKMAALLPNGPFISRCGGAIVVCGNIKKAYMESLSYMLQDCTAALQNILLAAPALGLGSCWLGVHPREERIAALREFFQLPDNIIPTAVCTLGYPADTPEKRTRFAEKYIHINRWQQKDGL